MNTLESKDKQKNQEELTLKCYLKPGALMNSSLRTPSQSNPCTDVAPATVQRSPFWLAIGWLQQQQPSNTGANPFSFQVHWILLHALHNTWANGFIRPIRSVTAGDSNPHSADQKHQNLKSVLLTARPWHFHMGVWFGLNECTCLGLTLISFASKWAPLQHHKRLFLLA